MFCMAFEFDLNFDSMQNRMEFGFECQGMF